MNMPGVGRCGVVGTEKFMICGGNAVDGRGGLGESELQVVVGDTRWRLGLDINCAQMMRCSKGKGKRATLRVVWGGGRQLRVDGMLDLKVDGQQKSLLGALTGMMLWRV